MMANFILVYLFKGTSTPAKRLSRILAPRAGAKLLPNELPMRLPTHFRNGTLRYTKVLGLFLGRMAGPIGWGILAYDVEKHFTIHKKFIIRLQQDKIIGQ